MKVTSSSQDPRLLTRHSVVSGSMQLILWERNPDVTAFVEAACVRAAISFTTVSTDRAMISAASRARQTDILVIDYSTGSALDIGACKEIFSGTLATGYIIHPHRYIVRALQPLSQVAITWIPAEFPALIVLERLRLARAMLEPEVWTAGASQPALSSREQEVYELIAREGYSDKQIADALGVEPCTVRTHVDHIKQKIGVKSRQELVAAYHRSSGLGSI
jgi:DNA-binding NarL/FixJ family response regulator